MKIQTGFPAGEPNSDSRFFSRPIPATGLTPATDASHFTYGKPIELGIAPSQNQGSSAKNRTSFGRAVSQGKRTSRGTKPSRLRQEKWKEFRANLMGEQCIRISKWIRSSDRLNSPLLRESTTKVHFPAEKRPKKAFLDRQTSQPSLSRECGKSKKWARKRWVKA